jgi:hypothetical protein
VGTVLAKNPWLQALYAAMYSFGLSAFAVFSTMAAVGWSMGADKGGFNNWPTFLAFMSSNWFAGVFGLVFQIGPYARARQGYTAVTSGTTPPPEQNQTDSAATPDKHN